MKTTESENEVFIKAKEIANQLEDQIKIVMPSGTDYPTILKVAMFTADRIKSSVPMYIGKLNPTWELYDYVFIIINGRLNGNEIKI